MKPNRLCSTGGNRKVHPLLFIPVLCLCILFPRLSFGADLEVSFEAGERMRTEVSCKYTASSVESILDEAGLALDEWFTGPDRAFALSLASPSQ